MASYPPHLSIPSLPLLRVLRLTPPCSHLALSPPSLTPSGLSRTPCAPQHARHHQLEATTGLNKSFSISTPPWGERTIDSEENSNPLSAADAPTPASSGVEATASSVETPAASSWQNGTIGSGTPSAETDHDSSSISSRSGGSSDALDFIGSVDAGVEGAVESVQEKAQEATDAVAAGEAWITGEESPPVAVQEVEEAVTSEASRLSDVASAAAGAAGSAAKQAEEAAGSALSAASSVVSAAAGATGDALSSSTEVVKSVAGDVIGSVESPEAAGGGGGSSSGTPEEEGSPKEQGADEAQAQMTEEDNTSPMAVALKEKEEREDAAREEIEGKKRRIRNEALSSVAEEMEVASAGLKRELEQSMLKVWGKTHESRQEVVKSGASGVLGAWTVVAVVRSPWAPGRTFHQIAFSSTSRRLALGAQISGTGLVDFRSFVC